ncbi:MAG: methionyl-tRNA formyltransferase [Armatimonadota bacterium]|nr:methionyl-tRNA formyltransferase [Armatimonadota bacterium]MDR7439647.1 methionyl-tRNA formyltransferase [Armatimonadota bacterium]MDR7563927.1 methionyl-tRNA formyltransferase [Armatimonadota bacterium]MDR7566755.1 methionyl-tRNA formyltransferase [Armatimonadota bacterium]
MRVLFFGTPEFALPSLEALHRAHRVVAAVTQPDRPAGRGQKRTPPPVAIRARELGLHVLQPERLQDVREELERLRPEVGVVVAYGKLIPRWLLDLPPHGFLNVHPSLLPRYRGASPIPYAVRNGDPETGVTVIRLTEELDAGPILAQQRVPVDPRDTAGTLEARLARVAADLLVQTLEALERGDIHPQPQDESAATYCGKLTKEDGRIRWEDPAVSIERHIRAMDPWPGAFTTRGERLLKIWRARVVPGLGSGRPGEIVRITREGFVVATGEGALEVLELQPPGGRRMPAAAYVRGHRVRAGEVLGLDRLG